MNSPYNVLLAVIRAEADQAAPRSTTPWRSTRMTIVNGILQIHGDPRVVDQCPWLLPGLLATVRVLGRVLRRMPGGQAAARSSYRRRSHAQAYRRRPRRGAAPGQMPLPGID